MRKIFVTATATALFFAAFLPAYAQNQVGIDPCTQQAGQAVSNALCSVSGANIGIVVRNVVVAVLVIAALIALFFLILGGIRWITSGGDKAKVDAARGTIIAAVVGLIITFLAYFILSLVLGLFGLSLTNLNIPKIIP